VSNEAWSRTAEILSYSQGSTGLFGPAFHSIFRPGVSEDRDEDAIRMCFYGPGARR